MFLRIFNPGMMFTRSVLETMPIILSLLVTGTALYPEESMVSAMSMTDASSSTLGGKAMIFSTLAVIGMLLLFSSVS